MFFDTYNSEALEEYAESIKDMYRKRFGEPMLFEFEKKHIKQLIFDTYSSNRTNWNMKMKPDLDWFIADVRKIFEKKKGIKFW